MEEDAEADGGDDRQRDRGLESEPVALLPFVSPLFKHAAFHARNREICLRRDCVNTLDNPRRRDLRLLVRVHAVRVDVDECLTANFPSAAREVRCSTVNEFQVREHGRLFFYQWCLSFCPL